jgi:branched-chain amino acid transport system substrate-binding protein
MTRQTLLTFVLLGVAPVLLGMDNCGGRGKVRFTAILPLTGAGQVYGESIQRGVELAFEDLSQDPQLGYTIALEVEDSASDPQHAVGLLEDAYSGSLAAIGGVTSDEALAMVEVADDAGKVLLSPSASSPKLSGISSNFFRIFPNSRDEAVAMTNFLGETLQVAELVVVQEETAYGEGLAGALAEVFTGQIVSTLKIASADQAPAVAREAVELDPKAVYLAADGDELAAVMKALRGAGFDGEDDWILSSSALANPRVIERAEGAAERSFLTQTVFDPTSEEEPMRSFSDDFQAKYGVLPDYYAAHGYDAMTVLVTALKEGGGTLPSDFMKGMRTINNFPGVTGNLQFRESGDVQKFVRIFYIAGGQLQDYVEWKKEREEEIRKRIEDIRRRRERLMRQQQNSS